MNKDTDYSTVIEAYGTNEVLATLEYILSSLQHPDIQPTYYTENFVPHAWVVTLITGLATTARAEIAALHQQNELLKAMCEAISAVKQ